MLLKQPSQENVVTQFLPKKLKLKLKDGERRPMSEMYGFLSGGLTTLICDEVSMLAALIRKNNVSTVDVSLFYLEECLICSNCIICSERRCLCFQTCKIDARSVWLVLHPKWSFLINEW